MESWPNSMVRAAVRRAVRARCMWGVGGTLEGEHELLAKEMFLDQHRPLARLRPQQRLV
jgi:hypothetical protein